jgi:acetoin utilization protein AcuC
MVIELLQDLNIYKEPILPSLIDPVQIKKIHDSDYVDTVEKLSAGEKIEEYEVFGLGTSDNPIKEGMAEGARYQVSGTLLGAKMLISGEAKKILQLGGGFHHAHYRSAAGFCIYNDLAAAIREMTDSGWHVAYLDIDVHHGDGVQELFYDDGNVMTISIHESGEYLFPGRGWIHELGQGIGRSLKLNVPLEPFSEGNSYFEVIDKVINPALSWFKPDAIIVQAGADAHFSDPLADNLLTTQDYEMIFRKIISAGNKYCNGRMLFTLGGGYSLTATPRIWTLLYIILNDLEIPKSLPKNWRNKWERILNKNMFETFHDPLPAYEFIPRRDEILQPNQDAIRRWFDSVAEYWI